MHLLLDALYFIPSEDGVAYVSDRGTSKNPDMKWGWGFRLGLAQDFKHDAWKTSLVWTCLPVQHDTTATGHLTPLWTDAYDYVESARVHWRLHLGIVDLDLERNWKISPYFEIAPHIGVRFASLREKFFVLYQGGSIAPGEEDNMHAKNKFWGVGPEMGAGINWRLGGHFSIAAKSTASLAYGEFYVHEDEREAGDHKLYNIFSQAAFLWDLALGMSWQSEKFSSHLSWENHWFPGQNHLGGARPGSLSVMGVSLGFDWKF